MDTKPCSSCGQVLPVEKFKWQGRRTYRAAQCNRCLYVKYTRPSQQKKLEKVHAYKVEKGCVDCGYNTNPYALEFDHLPGVEKHFNVGEKVGAYSETMVWNEIAKCEVVCANCHAIRSYQRRELVE